jgi:hypothetical protein
MELARPIAHGPTADVYLWQEGQVLKLFHNWSPLENIQYEQRIGSDIHAAYLRHYFDLRPGGEKEYHHWLPVVAAARLSENIPEIQQWVMKQNETNIIYPYGE